MSVRGDDDDTRWAARPTLARVLRVAVFASPVAAAVGVSSLAHLALGAAGSRVEQAWHLAVLIAVSTATLVVVDRVARRAVPLVTLLELSILFPDHAPSRFAVARDAVRNRPVEEQLARVRAAGADPAVAAREILGLVAALRAHDRPTRGHAERVRVLTDLVAEAMNVPARDRDLLRWAAILHDIGKLRVPPAILNKPGKPTDQEWALLRAHPAHGAQIAGALLPWLGEWGDVIVQHHERYDGTGYPSGLAGREISLGGRIVAVADAYEVMTATRAYRRPISRVAAHRELVRWSGQQFDPAVVRAMVGLSAPRLRRAQGLLAWFSDVPMVATSYVPAATVARVIGAGALATGVATGVGLPAAVVSAGTAHPEHGPVTSVGGADAQHAANAQSGPNSASNQADHAADLDGVADGPAASTASTTVPNAGGKAADAVPTTESADPAPKDSGSSTSGSSSSGSVRPKRGKGTSAVGTVTSTVNGTVSGVGTAVQGTVGTVTSTVNGTVGAVTGVLGGSGGAVGSVAGSVGTATGTVTGTVDSTVGTVTDTTTGTVTGVLNDVGGLLGSGKKKK